MDSQLDVAANPTGCNIIDNTSTKFKTRTLEKKSQRSTDHPHSKSPSVSFQPKSPTYMNLKFMGRVNVYPMGVWEDFKNPFIT